MELGELIEGKYRIVRCIGEGGMGAVYLGENIRISRRVAIKVLHAGYTEDREMAQRFENEAQAAGRIGNDHILEVLDLGMLPNGDHYIVMEYLDGEPLSARIKANGTIPPPKLAGLVRQVLVGLGAAHKAGITHRDLKPDNIFILKEKAGKRDFCKIIDFGISKFQSIQSDGMRMTRSGVLMGTPFYMSPEQAKGSHEADHRSDIYAVGVIMFEATTGRVPFEAATFNQLLFKIALDDVPKPETFRPDLDPAFASLISKAMARDRTQRFQSTDEFIRALDAWLERGASVSIPPSTDPAAASLVTRQSLELSSELRGKTGGNWATTQLDFVPVEKSRRGRWLALGGLLVVGTAGAVVLLRSGGEPSNAPPEAAVANVSAAPAALPAPPKEPVVVSPASPEPTAGATTLAPLPSAAPAPSAAPGTTQVQRSRLVGPKASPAEKSIPLPAAPAPAPPPAAAPAPPPAAPAPAPTRAKEPPRRDFGY